MKYLEINVFDQINDALAGAESGDTKFFGRVEAYSCKSAGEDKKLYRTLEHKYSEELEESPEILNTISPFGPLTQHASRKTLYYLISTLNSSFPDYDFSNAKPEQFTKQNSLPLVINSVNTSLSNIGEGIASLVQKLWESVDNEVDLKECDIYCYIPDTDSDPYADEGSIWSFHYFFYSKKRKRIIFFTFNAVSVLAPNPSMDEDDEDMMELENVRTGGQWLTFEQLMSRE